MAIDDLGGIERRFLKQLHEMTGGDPGRKVSMYEVGQALGLDREASGQAAEALIGMGLAEIRTLSGGIGISEAGIAEAAGAGGGAVSRRALDPARQPVLCAEDIAAVTEACELLKPAAGGLKLDFERLTELVADLRTIEAQLTSSRPKTAVVTACLRSMREVLAETDAAADRARLDALIGD